MKSNGSRTRVDIGGDLTASEIEDAITELAMLRSAMEPPVPLHRPNPMSDPDKPLLLEDNPEMTAALRRDGGFRLWVRNRGIGWMAFEVEPERAQALARYILDRSVGKGFDLVRHDDGKRH